MAENTLYFGDNLKILRNKTHSGLTFKRAKEAGEQLTLRSDDEAAL